MKSGVFAGDVLALPRSAFQQLLDSLWAAGFTVIGPTAEEQAVVLAEVTRTDQLPQGVVDEQAPGSYRLTAGADRLWFAHAVGQHSWKELLHASELPLFTIHRAPDGWRTEPRDNVQPRYALLGVRSCDLQAILRQDRVFLGGAFPDPHYARRRHDAFIVAVNCTRSTDSCFCVSMDTAPPVATGFDLALTELAELFLVQIGSERGASVLRQVACRPPTPNELNTAAAALATLRRGMRREFRPDAVAQALLSNLENPRWDEIAARCLSCGNCTLVCPTCFCTTVTDTADLSGASATRTRLWDSCFSQDFSHVYGGNTRPGVRSRYRQWASHKFASWKGQFGDPGCTGCGRCITWCPAGIDITAELNRLCEGVSP